VYIQRFPALGQKHRISTDGGLDLVWAPDGNACTIYLRSRKTAMMAVSIDTRLPVWVGQPEVLFERAYYRTWPGHRTYDLDPSRTRSLMIKADQRADATGGGSRIQVVLNWHEELKRLGRPTDVSWARSQVAPTRERCRRSISAVAAFLGRVLALSNRWGARTIPAKLQYCRSTKTPECRRTLSRNRA